ncbi:hypothetical protein QFW96_21550 [Saccharopolyspora sp. TS4A08]|uniref:Uncharacterized protein n=1 Tax=Saccharopolyspora ipomoeae TaxID=3042027 RepID=A0ABT6PTA2_9PSEU|nr:hypothetical protein [Saccharopolyspora sp. TS4A08]MDI2031229.1 hypothetical protein [Saccharopolyspora sp. TS4A08]
MTPRISGLAEKNIDGTPDPDHVRLWGMDLETRAVLYWREQGKSQFAVFDTVESADERFGRLFDLALYFPQP